MKTKKLTYNVHVMLHCISECENVACIVYPLRQPFKTNKLKKLVLKEKAIVTIDGNRHLVYATTERQQDSLNLY